MTAIDARRSCWPTGPAGWFALMGLVALLQGCGATLLRTPCDKPRISNFGVPSSYVVMLPHRYHGSLEENRNAVAHLNQLAVLQALQGAVEMPGTHITLVEGDPGDPRCEIEQVYDAVIENRSGLFWRRLYQSAVFVWGEAYDRGEDLVVQSHLRVFWNGSDDRQIRVSIDLPRSGGTLLFLGDLPLETISFPPARVQRTAALSSAEVLAAGLQVRTEPRLDAPVTKLPRRFAALAWKPPWLKLQDRDGQVVWLQVEGGGVGPLQLPAALFARALSTYLNHRVNGDERSRRYALMALQRFRGAIADTAGDPVMRMPLALADVIEGTLGLIAEPGKAEPAAAARPTSAAAAQLVQVQNSLTDAARRLPYNGEVLNLAAISRIPDCCDGPDARRRIGEIQFLLERAEALELGNARIAGNLVNWYRYLTTQPDAALPFGRAELAARLEAARQSLKSWSGLGKR